MLINGIEAKSYTHEGDKLNVVFAASIDAVISMEQEVVTVQTDSGSIVETFSGYVKRRVYIDMTTGYVGADFLLMDGDIAKSLSSLAEQVSQVASQSNEKMEEVKAQNDEIMLAIAELGTLVTGA